MTASAAMAVEVSIRRSKSLVSLRLLAEPGEGALDDPSARQQMEPLGTEGSFDGLEPQSLPGRRAAGKLALVASVGEPG